MAVGIDRLPVQESCCTPPTVQLNEAAALQASVTDGGFSYGPNVLHDRLLNDPRPRVPVNPETGLAYPIILPRRKFGDDLTRHHHNFPGSYLLGMGIRHVYVQRVYTRLHNDGPKSIHEQFSIPTELPQTPDDERGTFVMGLACHVPYEGMDLLTGEPTVRVMSRAEENRVMEPGVWGLANLQQDLSKVPGIHMRWRSGERRQIPEREANPAHHFAGEVILAAIPYVDAYNRRGKKFAANSHPEIGYEMLREASRLAVENTYFRGEGLVTKYNQAHSADRLRRDSPRECGDLLLAMLGTRGGLGTVFDMLKRITREEIAPPEFVAAKAVA